MKDFNLKVKEHKLKFTTTELIFQVINIIKYYYLFIRKIIVWLYKKFFQLYLQVNITDFKFKFKFKFKLQLIFCFISSLLKSFDILLYYYYLALYLSLWILSTGKIYKVDGYLKPVDRGLLKI